MSKPVAILGCGPAGLVAATALRMLGRDVSIFSRARKSEMFGAQYLHRPIPGIPFSPPTRVKYELRGTEADYKKKVYGKDFLGQTSPEYLQAEHDAWDIREMYDYLWNRHRQEVADVDITYNFVGELIDSGKYDMIFSSIPAPRICFSGHHFASTTVWAVGDAPARQVWCPITCPPGTVICNGEKEPGWYRVSNVFSHTTAEWPGYARPPMEVAEVTNPLFTNCSCWDEATTPVVGIGRYGAWQKGVLVHEVFDAVFEAASSRG